MRTRSSVTVALAIVLALSIPAAALAQGAPAQGAEQVPQPTGGGVDWAGVGYGGATVLADVVYVPIKLLYVLTGGLVGGGAYLLTAGNSQVSNTIWRSSLGGDYVLTPEMIKGNQPIHFSGPTETEGMPSTAAAAPAAEAAPAAGAAPAPAVATAPAVGAAVGTAPAAGTAPPVTETPIGRMSEGGGAAANTPAAAPTPDRSIE